ncbi:hypothetical protein GWK47_052947 [Chionoecetes opilio]|uniref:Uncharacterized protein n=1 Tax=Chionoecetes opilio TaxID=41210 RepID=A0A8J4Y1B4_CHIOP|nr:hypothetical protein GWK47_052947 [Chionoecetes opilio]
MDPKKKRGISIQQGLGISPQSRGLTLSSRPQGDGQLRLCTLPQSKRVLFRTLPSTKNRDLSKGGREPPPRDTKRGSSYLGSLSSSVHSVGYFFKWVSKPTS